MKYAFETIWGSCWSVNQISYFPPPIALEAEAIALLESLKMATTNGMHEVIFKTDSKTHGW
jgi:hypothetical protein